MQVAYRARYVFPVAGPPIEDGCVVVQQEHIVAVGRDYKADELHDFGNAAILPGLVNAHTHLEFSQLAQPLGGSGMGFADWVRTVIQHRQSAPPSAESIACGAAESASAGVTALGEIAQPPWRWDTYLPCQVDAVVFLELLGLSADRAQTALTQARRWLEQNRPAEHLTAGLSPHAPYTLSWDLFQAAIALAERYNAPVAFHLAESQDELQLLRSHEGPFRQLFDELGFWVEGAIPCGSRPLDYLKRLSPLRRSLIIHGNYLDDEEIGFLAQRASRMALVYCPRTHAKFEHREHPWRRLLERGGIVALGTDSRATNPDLDLLAEMRLLAQDQRVRPETLLEIGTLGGAKALGLAGEMGTLTPGKLAHLTMVQLPEQPTRDPFELLFGTFPPVAARIWRGRFAGGPPAAS